MCCCKRKSKPKAWSKLCKLREKKKNRSDNARYARLSYRRSYRTVFRPRLLGSPLILK